MLASSPKLSTAVVAALATLVARHPAIARRPKPTACDAGSFALDAQGSEEATTTTIAAVTTTTTTTLAPPPPSE